MGAGADVLTGVPTAVLTGVLTGVPTAVPAGTLTSGEVIGARVGPAELEPGDIVNGAGTLTVVDGTTAALGFSRLNVSGIHFPRSSSYSNSNR